MSRFLAVFRPSAPLLRGDWLTAERVRRIGAIFALLALIVVGSDAWLHTSRGWTDADGQQLGRDFVNYWAGAHLAAGGRWRAFAAAGLTALAICASAFLLGPAVWSGFLKNAPINAGLLEIGDSMWHRMPTAFATVRLAGGSIGAAYAVQCISALIAIAATIRIWRSGATDAVKGSALVVATFLVTPYAWDYDQIALTFVAAWLAAEGARHGFQPGEKIAIAFGIAAPLIYSPLAAATHVQIAPLAPWAMMGLIARRAFGQGDRAQAAAAQVQQCGATAARSG